MSRTTSDAQITTKAARERLPVQHEPHWRGVEGGLAIGYRKTATGGSWMARLRIGGRYEKNALGRADDLQKADGTVVLDHRQAQAKAITWAAKRQRITLGHEPEPTKVARQAYTVADATADYLADYQARGGKAVPTTRTSIAAHILPALGRVPVERLTRAGLRDWHRGLAAAAPRRRRRKGSEVPEPATAPVVGSGAMRARQATANRILTIVKAALNHARAEGKVTCSADAWALVRPFAKVDTPKVRYLSADETTRLINASTSDFRTLVAAALLTGCRYGELAAMRVEAFEADTRSVFVRESKAGRSRHVALSDEGVEFFTAQTAGRESAELLFGRDAVSKQATRTRAVELRRVGWMNSDQFRAIATACKAAHIIPSISFHILRHTYASRLAMNGAGLQVIAAQLGHSGTRMTERHYAHLAPSFVAEEVRAKLGMLGVATAIPNVVPLRLKMAT